MKSLLFTSVHISSPFIASETQMLWAIFPFSNLQLIFPNNSFFSIYIYIFLIYIKNSILKQSIPLFSFYCQLENAALCRALYFTQEGPAEMYQICLQYR